MTFRTALAGLAALFVAAPAASAASPPSVPVEAGAVEHRVRTYKMEASYTVAGVPRHVRTEEWIARGRYHSRTTDVASGALVAETTQDGARVATWDTEEGLWTGSAPKGADGKPRLVGHSFGTEAAMNRSVIDFGWYELIAETADALTYESTPEAPSDGDNTTTMVLKRSDLTVVRRETVSRLENGGFFRQVEETEVAETLRAGREPARAFSPTKAKLAKARAAKKRKRSASRSYRR